MASARKIVRRKHVPQRTCVGCRKVHSKRTLIRIVRHVSGVQVDPTGKLAGRGAYLHDDPFCWKEGLKGSLAQALKIELTVKERESLIAFAESLKPVEKSK